MANNLVIDGNLAVGGTMSSSGVNTVTGTENFTGTASFSTGSAVFFSATTLTITAGNTSTQGVAAVTLNTRAAKITTTALTAAGYSCYSVVVTNSAISATDMIFGSLTNGSNTTTLGGFSYSAVNGAVTLQANTISPLNGTIVFTFAAFK